MDRDKEQMTEAQAMAPPMTDRPKHTPESWTLCDLFKERDELRVEVARLNLKIEMLMDETERTLAVLDKQPTASPDGFQAALHGRRMTLHAVLDGLRKEG